MSNDDKRKITFKITEPKYKKKVSLNSTKEQHKTETNYNENA